MREYSNVLKQMELWLVQPDLEPTLREELLFLEGNLKSESRKEAALEEVYERFYKDLAFGTGGLRGILGAGTNRMNVYTVGKVTQGLADYINRGQVGTEKPRAAISYDSRIYSKEFAHKAAQVLSENKIDVFLFKELMPTPALSFAVRYFGCAAGIMITASHNPAKYNGYKAYNDKGCQLNLEEAEAVIDCINQVDLFCSANFDEKPFSEGMDGESGIIEYISDEVVSEYIEAVKRERTGVDCSDLVVVYTPLNGAGNRSVRRILKEIGVSDIEVVPEQEKPDGNFPTCPYPNPEKIEALKLGLDLCEKRCQEAKASSRAVGGSAEMLKKPDLLLATDPDCDRVAAAVRVETTPGNDEFSLLSGNEIGILLLDYLCRMRKDTKKNGALRALPERPIAVKTIVSSKMPEVIANYYGVELIQVLTGFKFIGEQIGFLEDQGEAERFVFGFEESYGYLAGSYVRDKDAVNGSMLLCEMAAQYKKEGKTLIDRLHELYQQFGYYKNDLLDFAFEGAHCMQEMQKLLDELRRNPPVEIAGNAITAIVDYEKAETGLPKSDVLQYELQDGSRFIVRPSGTEPKLKIYLFTEGEEEAEVVEKLGLLKTEISKLVQQKCK